MGNQGEHKSRSTAAHRVAAAVERPGWERMAGEHVRPDVGDAPRVAHVRVHLELNASMRQNRIEKDLGEVEESIWTGSRQQSGESGVISAAVSGECQGSLGESKAAAGGLWPSGMMP